MKTKPVVKIGVVMLTVTAVSLFVIASKVHAPVSQDEKTSSNSDGQHSRQGVVTAPDEPADGTPKTTDTPFTLPNSTTPGAKAPLPKAPKQPPIRYVTINNKTYPVRTYQPLALPNDPSANQWWVTNTKLSETWDTPAGSNQTILAVIDTGVALNHEEFASRWHQNSGERGSTVLENPSRLNCSDRNISLGAHCNLIDDDADGIVDNESGGAVYQNPSRLNCTDQSRSLDKSCNQRDDDQNGYIDDVTGWDFVNNDNSTQAGELNPAGTGVRHGTMVAGVAAATGNNGVGMAGVDWHTKLLPIQALDDDSYGDTLSVGRAIYYAISQGADVINISLGSQLEDDFVREAIETATRAGIVVVAASGNDGCECILYPANYPEVVAVGALNSSGTYAGFSSWGAELDILAPGTGYTTPSWTAGNTTATYASGASGTSFASPMVAGLMTRIKSQQPNITPLQLIAALTENSTKLGTTSTTTHDKRFGFGSVASASATTRALASHHEIQSYQFEPVQAGAFLNPSQPTEVSGSYLVRFCAQPTTPVYELLKGGARFYSISKVEVRDAVKLGYTKTLLGYGCLQQPQDTQDIIRSINLLREFRNIYTKP